MFTVPLDLIHGITLQTSEPSISVAQPAQQSKWSSQCSAMETEQFAGTPAVTYFYLHVQQIS